MIKQAVKNAAIVCCILLLSGCSLLGRDGDDTDDILSLPGKTAKPVVEPQPTYTDEPVFNEPEPDDRSARYKSRVSVLNVRSKPDLNDNKTIIAQLGYEEEVTLLTQIGEFSLVRLDDGREAYCYSDYLVQADLELFAYLKPETTQKRNLQTDVLEYNNDGTPMMVKNELIDLRLYLPDAQYELLFATDRNVMGEPLYSRAIPLLQKEVAIKLKAAFDMFKADGYTLKIYDAYRPISVQRILYAKVKNKHWIANPNTTASNHNRGAAVDISLIDDATGTELSFPTPMHTFADEAARDHPSWTEEQKNNVDYMTSVMEKCGFLRIASEWWHFGDKDSANYMTTDINLAKINMEPKH